MRRRIIFRADASKHIGFGHFFRSLALADYLKDDYECLFATYNAEDDLGVPTFNQLNEIERIGKPLAVGGRALDEYNEAFFEEIGLSDIIVLDNYYYTTEYQQRIKDKGCKLVCINDVHDRHMVCDLLITPCPLVRGDFSTASYTLFRGGLKYAFLRPPFFNPKPFRRTSMPIRRVVTAMGGADAYNLTDKIIGIVSNLMPPVHIDVIVGETAEVKAISGPLLSIHRNISAEQIVRIFDSVDLGIFPTSTVCMEAFSRNLPVIAGYYVDNQRELYDYCKGKGYISAIGDFSDSPEEISKRLGSALEKSRPEPATIDFEEGRQEILDLFKQL